MKDNRASSTAFTVLQGILYTAQKPQYEYLVSEEVKETARLILASSEEGKKRLNQLNSFWRKVTAPLMERIILPGITLHYVLRKRYIEDYTLQSIEEGITQVINLGAGLDTLAYRLSQVYRQVNFIEVDRPATKELKVQFLNKLDKNIENYKILSIDFNCQSLEEELSNFSGFFPDRPTLFIAEGVLMYLTELQVTELLNSLQRLTSSEMRLIFTFINVVSEKENKFNFNIFLTIYLRIIGEPLLWTKPQKKLANFLKNQGYDLQQVIIPDDLKNLYLSPDYKGTLQKLESIAVAEKLCQ